MEPFIKILKRNRGEKMPYSILTPAWFGLWLFAIIILLGYCMRWWPGDQLKFVRLINYTMPWLLVGLLPGLIFAGLAHRKLLALALCVPTFLIIVNYLPLFWNFSKSTAANKTSLKVMSYNVWRENQNITAVAGVIRNEKPDILLLQELRQDVAQELVTELNDLYPDTQPHYQYEPEMLQGIVSRYPLTALEATPQKGRAQKVHVESPFGRITLINIHAYKWRWMRRYQQMQRLLSEDVATSEYPVILGGDFNTNEQSQTYRLVNKYLNNAHREAGCGFGFTYPSSSLRIKNKYSIPALIRIDHIFYSSHFNPFTAGTLKYSGGSDHLPVVAAFSIN